jgi:WD40 repeat protein
MTDKPAAPAELDPPATPAPPAPSTTPTPGATLDPTAVKELRQWKLGRAVLTCRIDPSGRYVVAGEMDTLLTQFDLTTPPPPPPTPPPAAEAKPKAGKKPAPQLSPGIKAGGARSWITSPVFAPDGSRLFAGDHAGQLLAWSFPFEDTEENSPQKPVWTRQAHKGCLRVVAVSPDGTTLATCGNDDRVRLWSADTGELKSEFVGHEGDVYHVAFHPSGEHLVSGDVTGILKHWELASGKTLRELDMKLMFKEEGPIRSGGARSMTFNPAGSLLACGGLSQIKQVNSPKGVATALIIDWQTGRQKFVLLPKSKTDGFVNGLAFHPSGFIVGVTGGASSRAGVLLFWKLPDDAGSPEPNEPPADGQTQSPAPLEVTTFHEFKTATSGWAMDLHSDARHLVIAHHDTWLREYDLSPAPEPSKPTA